ncbi:glutathione S-transferase [Zavarzinia compransoris]|uniref:glutathione S-transferase family protein n=1 Tax=Zavarzinia marina TaxID=2911065 RepID=UPI001F3C433D|nr:glutathione S-transferase [Zavarzinia marina]MCF4166919.1 glutathione S-transferase [Zavarzinia marina]
MIQVHHLNNSRSQRVLWLLEELGLAYEILPYARDAETQLAPAGLKAIHPLGKSPVITDGDLVIAESGAIVDYLVQTYGAARFGPGPSTAEKVAYHHFLHFAEGSAMLPLMLTLYTSRLGDAAAPLMPRIRSEVANHLGYMEAALGDRPFFLGDTPRGPDFLLIFIVELARLFGYGEPYPRLADYARRIHDRPAYQAAIEKGGTYAFAL